MLSSMYHHVSIVKLKVHVAYVDYLEHGKLPDPLPADPTWCQPKMQRSQWFNFFDIPQRVEAFKCLWGVMSYLTRSTGEDAVPGAMATTAEVAAAEAVAAAAVGAATS